MRGWSSVWGIDPIRPGFGEERSVLRTVVKAKIHRATVTLTEAMTL
jgi:hypothetical protein